MRTYKKTRREVTVDCNEELLRCDYCGVHAPFKPEHVVKMGELHQFEADSTGWTGLSVFPYTESNDLCPTCTKSALAVITRSTK